MELFQESNLSKQDKIKYLEHLIKSSQKKPDKYIEKKAQQPPIDYYMLARMLNQNPGMVQQNPGMTDPRYTGAFNFNPEENVPAYLQQPTHKLDEYLKQYFGPMGALGGWGVRSLMDWMLGVKSIPQAGGPVSPIDVSMYQGYTEPILNNLQGLTSQKINTAVADRIMNSVNWTSLIKKYPSLSNPDLMEKYKQSFRDNLTGGIGGFASNMLTMFAPKGTKLNAYATLLNPESIMQQAPYLRRLENNTMLSPDLKLMTPQTPQPSVFNSMDPKVVSQLPTGAVPHGGPDINK